MRFTTRYAAAATLSALVVFGSAYAKPIVYPAKGQSTQQQQKDDGECYVWAKNNTGVDPAAPPPAAAPAPAPAGAPVAKGALAGAAIGGIANGSDGAKTGAAIGVVGGAIRKNKNQQAQQQQAAQAQSINQGAMDTYNRAYSACMTGRGYTVN